MLTLCSGANSWFNRSRNRGVVLWATACLLLLAGRAGAQQTEQDEQSTNQQSNKLNEKYKNAEGQGANSDQEDLPTALEDTDTQASPDQPVLVSMETGQVLNRPNSRFRWGRLSLFSVSVVHVYDDVSVGPTKTILNTEVIRPYVLYSLKRGRKEIDFQYLPQLVFSNQGHSLNFGSQAAEFHISYRLGSRWSLNLSDSFSYEPNPATVSYIPEPGFVPDFPTGSVWQNPFLTPNQAYWSTLFQPTLSYHRGRNHLSFLVRYEFLHATTGELPVNSQAGLGANTASGGDHLGGGGIEWGHNWNSTNAIGLTADFDRRYYSAGGTSNFYSLIVSYSRRLSPGLFLDASIGPTLMTQNDAVASGNPLQRRFTYEGSFILTKSFRRSGLAFAFERNHTASQYLGGTQTDLYGISYSHQFGRRWSTGVGAGYMHQDFNGPSNKGYKGRTTWDQISYRLTRDWSVYVTYLRFWDSGLQAQSPATHNFVVTGVRWSMEEPPAFRIQ